MILGLAFVGPAALTDSAKLKLSNAGKEVGRMDFVFIIVGCFWAAPHSSCLDLPKRVHVKACAA